MHAGRMVLWPGCMQVEWCSGQDACRSHSALARMHAGRMVLWPGCMQVAWCSGQDACRMHAGCMARWPGALRCGACACAKTHEGHASIHPSLVSSEESTPQPTLSMGSCHWSAPMAGAATASGVEQAQCSSHSTDASSRATVYSPALPPSECSWWCTCTASVRADATDASAHTPRKAASTDHMTRAAARAVRSRAG